MQSLSGIVKYQFNVPRVINPRRDRGASKAESVIGVPHGPNYRAGLARAHARARAGARLQYRNRILAPAG